MSPTQLLEDTHGGLLTLRTSGTGGGLPDLEVVNVPPDMAGAARILLLALADQLSEAGEAIASGELLGVGLPESVMVVRVIDSPAAPRGGRQRLIAPEPDASEGEPPWSALASVVIDQAAARRDEGDDEGAEAVLRSSIALFPGDPARSEGEPLGWDYNRENALSYRMLAFEYMPAASGADFFVEALRRSADLQLFEMGASAKELASPDLDHAAELGRFIAYTTLSEEPVVESVGPGIAVMHSPIWYLDPTGHVARGTGPWPLAYLALFYEGAARRALEDARTIEAVVDALDRHRHDPLELMRRTFVTNRLWREVSNAPLATTDMPFAPLTRILSLLLAHVAHGAAAGLSIDEVRASLGADDDRGRAERAARALDGFEDTIVKWQFESTP